MRDQRTTREIALAAIIEHCIQSYTYEATRDELHRQRKNQRKAIYRERDGVPTRSTVIPECGTYAGWSRHKRRGEPIDDACRLAQLEYYRDWKRKRRNQ